MVGSSDLIGQPSAPQAGSPLLQSGMNGWGLAPVSGSRDALAMSAQYKQRRKLLLTARSELRLELARVKRNSMTQPSKIGSFSSTSSMGASGSTPIWRSWDALRSLRSTI